MRKRSRLQSDHMIQCSTPGMADGCTSNSLGAGAPVPGNILLDSNSPPSLIKCQAALANLQASALVAIILLVLLALRSNHRLQSSVRRAWLAASTNAQAKYLLPHLRLFSPFFLPLELHFAPTVRL